MLRNLTMVKHISRAKGYHSYPLRIWHA